MELSPFLLDQWLNRNKATGAPIDFDLGSSTGPVWTLGELLEHGGFDHLLDTRLFYTGPAGSTELREAIGKLEGVDPASVVVVTGGSEALLIFFFLAAEAGANVVLPSPGFPTNAAFCDALGLEARFYRLHPQNGYRIDLDEIRSLTDRNTRFVLVNSPHNPTGAILTPTEMESLHDFCVDRGVQLIADQVYHPIYYGPEPTSAAKLPHATVLGDFSKALCLSGLRIGWIIERDPERRERYVNARSYFTVSGNALGERIAALALSRSEEIYGRARRIAQSNLALLDAFFDEHRDVLDWVPPRGGMTCFPWLKGGGDARPFCENLIHHGVLVAPGDCFGMPAHFRLGFAASAERFPLALDRFSEFLRNEAMPATLCAASDAH